MLSTDTYLCSKYQKGSGPHGPMLSIYFKNQGGECSHCTYCLARLHLNHLHCSYTEVWRIHYREVIGLNILNETMQMNALKRDLNKVVHASPCIEIYGISVASQLLETDTRAQGEWFSPNDRLVS